MYDPDYPADLDPNVLDFEALDLVEQAQGRRLAATLDTLFDLPDDDALILDPTSLEGAFA